MSGLPAPRYPHDCAHCEYLGQHEEYDLYVHRARDFGAGLPLHALVARDGRAGGEYYSTDLVTRRDDKSVPDVRYLGFRLERTYYVEIIKRAFPEIARQLGLITPLRVNGLEYDDTPQGEGS